MDRHDPYRRQLLDSEPVPLWIAASFVVLHFVASISALTTAYNHDGWYWTAGGMFLSGLFSAAAGGWAFAWIHDRIHRDDGWG